MKDWTYEELFSKSDFVVIAEPISATHDTDERTNLEGIAPPLPVIGVATDFKTLLVLKGQKQDRFVLHHYRLAKSDVALINGPQLVAFGPTEYPAYLLFLVRERDGRFAPVDGQTDPGLFSVKRLSETGKRKSPNQTMKPTAHWRNKFSEFATTPCRGLSLSR